MRYPLNGGAKGVFRRMSSGRLKLRRQSCKVAKEAERRLRGCSLTPPADSGRPGHSKRGANGDVGPGPTYSRSVFRLQAAQSGWIVERWGLSENLSLLTQLGLVDAPHLDRVMDKVQTGYGALLGRLPWVHAVTPSDPVGPASVIKLPNVPESEANS